MVDLAAKNLEYKKLQEQSDSLLQPYTAVKIETNAILSKTAKTENEIKKVKPESVFVEKEIERLALLMKQHADSNSCSMNKNFIGESDSVGPMNEIMDRLCFTKKQ